MYYKTCVYCGANLDVGEKCDCHEEIRANNEHKKVVLNEENNESIKNHPHNTKKSEKKQVVTLKNRKAGKHLYENWTMRLGGRYE